MITRTQTVPMTLTPTFRSNPLSSGAGQVTGPTYSDEMIKKAVQKWSKRFPFRAHTVRNKKRARKAGAIGSHTGMDFVRLCLQYGNRCLCCGKKGVKLTADHVIPLCREGTNNIDNIQPLCIPCNYAKGQKVIDYR